MTMNGNSDNIFSLFFDSISGVFGSLLGVINIAGLFGGVSDGLGGFFQALIAPWVGN